MFERNPFQFKCTITQRIVKASYDAEANSFNNIHYTIMTEEVPLKDEKIAQIDFPICSYTIVAIPLIRHSKIDSPSDYVRLNTTQAFRLFAEIKRSKLLISHRQLNLNRTFLP